MNKEIKPYSDTQGCKSEQVRDMFDAIAPKYDLLNHLLSMSIDRLWRRQLVALVRRENSDFELRILDVATGTGDLALALARVMPGAKVVGVDLSEKMIEVARAKVKTQKLDDRIELTVGDAQELDSVFERNSFGVVTAAFGVRNFEELSLGLSGMYNVLQRGGRAYILEFSNPSSPIFARLYKLYFHGILPRVGSFISRDAKAYSYLPRSVEYFVCGHDFVKVMQDVGFIHCGFKKLSGGIATIYYGIKI